MYTVNKEFLKKLFESCYPTGMECRKCGGKHVSFNEIEDNDGNTVALHLSCSKCMRTFMEIDVVEPKAVHKFVNPKSCNTRCG